MVAAGHMKYLITEGMLRKEIILVDSALLCCPGLAVCWRNAITKVTDLEELKSVPSAPPVYVRIGSVPCGSDLAT